MHQDDWRRIANDAKNECIFKIAFHEQLIMILVLCRHELFQKNARLIIYLTRFSVLAVYRKR